jgi:hypothetical protein
MEQHLFNMKRTAEFAACVFPYGTALFNISEFAAMLNCAVQHHGVCRNVEQRCSTSRTLPLLPLQHV